MRLFPSFSALMIGLLIGLLLPPSSSAASLQEILLKDMAMPHSSQLCTGSSSSTKFNYAFSSSQNRSEWGQDASFVEQDLFLVEMASMDNDLNLNKSFVIRLGVGGQIYSFYGAFGEAIAPQWTPDSLWVDEVFMNGGVPQSNVGPNGVVGGIHGAGTYVRDPELRGKPFWSPTLGHACFDNTCIVAVWAQQAHVPTTFQSAVLGYWMYRDCGNGVLEHTNIMHVFRGPESETTMVHLNTPWVGLRLTTFKDVLPSIKDEGLMEYQNAPFPTTDFGQGLVHQRNTDGYITYVQDLPLPDGAENMVDIPCYQWKRNCTTTCQCACDTNLVCHDSCAAWKDEPCETACGASTLADFCVDDNGQGCSVQCTTTCTNATFHVVRPVCGDQELVHSEPPYRLLRFVVPPHNGVVVSPPNNWASLPTHDFSDFPTQEELPNFQIDGPWVPCPFPVGVTRCLYLCGFLYTNVRTGQSVVVDSLRVWAFRRTGRSFVHIDLEVYTEEYLNEVFYAGDEIRITIRDCGMDPQDNLAMSLVHGNYSDRSVLRYGVAHQNVMVYVSVCDNNNKKQKKMKLTVSRAPQTSIDNVHDILPFETYVNNNYAVVGRFVDAEEDVAPWINESRRKLIPPGGHPTSRRLEIYADPSLVSFDVLFAPTPNSTDTVCHNADNDLVSVCVGSSTPDVGLVAHFYIECGEGQETYFGPDPYALGWVDINGIERPWICASLDDTSVRPTWKLMGYFPVDCDPVQDAIYVDGSYVELCQAPAEEEESTPLPSEAPSDTPTASPSSQSGNFRADWMSGRWGVGVRVPGGCYHLINGVRQCYYIDNFDVGGFVEQVKSIGNVGWVIIGITSGANGLPYITWHSVLNRIAPLAAPLPPELGGRDLFGEVALALRAEGIRTIAYVATEGPAKLRHGVARAFDYNATSASSASVDAWYSFVETAYGSNDTDTMKLAFAEVIIGEFAERYESLIAGWWFDHSSFGDREALVRVIRAANPDAVIALNQGQKVPLVNNHPGFEDYTFGHPTPVAREPASSMVNLPMVESIEESDNGYLWRDGYASLGHMFMPVSTSWNGLQSNTSVWTTEQAQDWMSRVLESGGSWTWNSACTEMLLSCPNRSH